MKEKDKIKKDTHHYLGHRKRLKEKFISNDSKNFSDYELLELLLFYSVPRKDVKPLAKQLLNIFGDFKNLINAEYDKISQISDMNDKIFLQLKLVRELITRSLLSSVKNHNIISSWSALLSYLKFNMGSLKIEQFRILFLTKQNKLIADDIMSTGTLNKTAVYPREIVKKALFYDAGAIILVHNHPGGSVEPSGPDIDLTREIVVACNAIEVNVHDHVIIAQDDYYSFKSNLLL